MLQALIDYLNEWIVYNPKNPMIFNSGQFLLFFTFVFVLYAFVYPSTMVRTVYLLLISLFFYYKSSGVFVLLLVFCIGFNYAVGILMHERSRAVQKAWLWGSTVVNLSFLLYFKYTNFFLSNVYTVTGQPFEPLDIFLPVGISFFTFQTISYIVDIYRGDIEPCDNIIDFGFYLSFFPQLVAGPIVRAKDFLPQIHRRIEYRAGTTDTMHVLDAPIESEEKISLSRSNLGEGLFMILKGFIKKAIIADYVAQYSDLVFANPDGFSGVENWIAMYAYTLQIYCDFSGYSDMAIGISLLFGFRLLDNFRSPYQSLNITEFWRRWHISLSFWLRDYVYISLGGNRRGTFNRYLFLLITMLVGGFWHGANWKFVFWGAMHGAALIVHKLWLDYVMRGWRGNWLTKTLGWFITFHFVAFLWVYFRAESFDVATSMIYNMFADFDLAFWQAFWQARPMLIIMLLLGFSIHFVRIIDKNRAANYFASLPALGKALLFLLAVQAALQFQSADVQPFLYFQF